MTEESNPTEHSELESTLDGIAHLRELAELDGAPLEAKRAIELRLRRTLAQDVPAYRRKSRARTGLLAFGFWVVVPSALAATAAGSGLFERALRWTPQLLEFAGLRSHPAALPQVVNDVAASEREQSVPAASAVASVQSAQARFPDEARSENEARSGATASTSSAAARGVNRRAADGPDVARPKLAAPSSVSWSDRFEAEPLDRERRLLQSARLRLRAGDRRGALELTAQHARQFPDGLLTAERNAIIRQAQQLGGGSQ